MTDFGGRNDRALVLVQETDAEMFFLRAEKDSGNIVVMLNCNDIFVWGAADEETLPEEYWGEFEASWQKALSELDADGPLRWFSDAWAVKLRKVAPQKPATDRNTTFVEMLDWLEVPWRKMKRYDQWTTASTPPIGGE
ncbi:MAG: hypothetical protein V6Z86_05525 [Hyphomicrobiales bacterium]